jgi:hypothetical protein
MRFLNRHAPRFALASLPARVQSRADGLERRPDSADRRAFLVAQGRIVLRACDPPRAQASGLFALIAMR